MIVGIIGAGGKMGCRITDNLVKKNYQLLLCENGKAGIERLEERGLSTTGIEELVRDSEIIILAVPDAKINSISRYIVPLMKTDQTLITLDPAAAFAGELYKREDCTFVVTHPCHPALFHEQKTDEA